MKALIRKLGNIHPDHQRIFKGAFRVAVFLLLSKAAGAVKEMAVAYRYGVSDAVDAYQFTMTMATWLPVTIVGVLSVVLIPVLVRLRRAERAERDDFIRELQGWVLAAGIALALLTWLAWPYALDWLGGGLSPQVRAMTGDLLVAFAPVSALLLVAGISAARLRAHERHVNTLLDSVPAVATLAWVMLAVSADGVGPLLWALSLATPSRRSGSPGWPRGPIPDSGGATRYLALAALAGIDGRRRRDADRPGGDELCRPAGPVCRRQSGANANATLGYASRLLSLILGIGAVSVGRAALPVLADVQSRGDTARARSMALKWSLLMVLAGAGAVALGWLLAPWGVSVLFQRGAFTAENTQAVAQVLRWGCCNCRSILAC